MKLGNSFVNYRNDLNECLTYSKLLFEFAQFLNYVIICLNYIATTYKKFKIMKRIILSYFTSQVACE